MEALQKASLAETASIRMANTLVISSAAKRWRKTARFDLDGCRRVDERRQLLQLSSD